MRLRLLDSRLVGLGLLVLAVGLVGGFLLGRQVSMIVAPRVKVPRHAQAEFELMAEAWGTIEREYVNQEAVGVTSRFVESGNVVLRRDAASEVGEEAVREDVQAVDLPMVALINGGTASAAEIVTGALQDHERAATVGKTTFGAGTVLNRFPLADGAVVLLAVEEWLTPEGRVLWQRGLAPDVEVDLAPDAEPLVRLMWEDLTEAKLRDSGDEQLLRALELLHSSSTDEES